MNTIYPQQPYYQLRPASNSIIWVQGIEGAKAYQVTPNSIVQLMDSENDGIFYIKVSDNIGMSTLRTFRYTEIEQAEEPKPQTNLSEYVRKDELQELITTMLAKEDSHEQTISAVQQSNKHKSTIQ